MSVARQSLRKQPVGWFVAGHEVDDALRSISENALRLFIWLRLPAGIRMFQQRWKGFGKHPCR
jgi:hypothetical protein